MVNDDPATCHSNLRYLQTRAAIAVSPRPSIEITVFSFSDSLSCYKCITKVCASANADISIAHIIAGINACCNFDIIQPWLLCSRSLGVIFWILLHCRAFVSMYFKHKVIFPCCLYSLKSDVRCVAMSVYWHSQSH